MALLGPAAPARAAWSSPLRLSTPGLFDLAPTLAALAPNGLAAVGFGQMDEDNPASAQALLVTRRGARTSRARQVPRSQQILGLAFDGQTLELLTGNSPAGRPCCSTALQIPITGSRFGSAHVLVRGLTGPTVGRLVIPAAGQLLAAVATARGVWVTQSTPSGRFGRAITLSSRTSQPQQLVATGLGNGQTVVAFTATTGPDGPGPRAIEVASGSPSAPPSRSHVAITVPRAHQVQELGISPAATTATFAWIEGWFGARGGYQSEVVTADLQRHLHPHLFLTPPGSPASGLAFAGNVSGDEALAWKVCGARGSCGLRAAFRRGGGRWGAVQRLAPIDPSQVPAVSVGPTGIAALGWISFGHVYAAVRLPGELRFGPAREISSTSYAADLALAAGPTGEAIATWTQGTFMPSANAAIFSG